MNQNFSDIVPVVSVTVSTPSIQVKPILAKCNGDDDDGDEILQDSEAEEAEEGSDEEQEQSSEEGGDVANASTSTASRNVGKKYKRWASEKERNKHYKKLNYGPTIATRKKIGEEKIYEPIPPEGLIIEGYTISQFARIRLQNGSITTGSTGDRAKVEIPGYGSFIVSRLVASSFGILQDNSHDVDHIDPSRPLDNSLKNLQGMNRSDHTKKTHKDNPQMSQKTQQSLSKPILGRRYLSNDEFTHYISSRDAEKKTGANSANIRTICAKRQQNPRGVYQCGGYEFKYAERDMGEKVPADAVWKPIKFHEGYSMPHSICQYGLIRRNDNYITRGVLKADRYEFVSYQVSILVALAFLPPPAREDQSTVNHKDLNPLNNHVSNLEWASDREQVVHSLEKNKNRKSGCITKKCRYIAKGSDVWITCDSMTEASKQTGVSVRALRNNFHRDNFTEKGFRFEELAVPLLPGENFIPLKLYFKQKHKPRRAPAILANLNALK